MWKLSWKINKLWEYLLVMLLLLPCFTAGQDFLWQTDPLKGRKTNLLFPAQSGLMVVGTDQGLFSYDGVEWISLPRPDSLLYAPTAICEQNDTLWVGYEDGLLCYTHKGKLHIPNWEEGFPKVAISGIERDSSGILWFSTYGEGIYYLWKGRLYNLNTDDGLLDDDVYCLEQHLGGEMWVGTDRGISICSLKDGKKSARSLTIEEGLPDYIVKSLAHAPDGRMLIGMDEKGVCFFDPQDSSFSLPINNPNGMGGSVNSVYIDRHSCFIGTERGELWELYDRQLRHMYSFDAPVNTLTKDPEGNLWCGLESPELYRSSPDLMKWGQVPHAIQAIHGGSSSGVWLGTAAGLWKLDIRSPVPQKISLPPLNILSLFEDSYESLWIGTFGQGLWRYFPQTNQYQHYTEQDGLANDNILSIWGNEKDMWLATLGGVSQVQIPQGGSQPLMQNYDRERGLGTEYIYQVVQDTQGRVWIATDGKGLWYQEEKHFVQASQVRESTIYGIEEDTEQRIWFFTEASDLWALAGDSWVQYPMDSRQILGIQALDKGSILLLTDQGIDRVNHTNRTQYSTLLTELLPDWEPNLNALHKAADGSVWLSSQQSLFQYSPPPLTQQSQPRPILKEVSVYLEPIAEDKLSKLSHEENHLSFSYAGLWYQSPQSLTYRYRMQGLDLGWQETRSRKATYPKLAPGSYTFELQVSSTASFHRAETLRIPIQIHKPFWQRGWFIFLVLCLLAGIGYGLIQTREKRLQQKEALKRNQIRFQLETLQSQINPHFLFNSFNTLVSLIEEDKQHAVDYTERLSDFFRHILELKEESYITLKKELSLLQNYYEIQRNRYGTNFQLVVNVPPAFQQKILPPLSLQLLVENALKHNIASEKQPLIVEIYVEEELLHIRNNMQRKRGDLPSTKLGLNNIIKRFELLGSQNIHIQDGPDFFHVMLPLIDPLSHENPHH